MDKNRIEAFSDGIIAIIITIMVLEMRAPAGTSWGSLEGVSSEFLSYILSFVYLAIYWNNHHHLFKAVRDVNGQILWANLHLLFWLSLIPFTSEWMWVTQFSQIPVIVYGLDLLFAAIAYWILVQVLLAHHGPGSLIAKAIGSHIKEKISIVIYILAIGLSFIHAWISCALYVAVAIMWIVPDQRIERNIVKG